MDLEGSCVVGLNLHANAWAEFNTLKKDNVDTGQVTSGDFFGTKRR